MKKVLFIDRDGTIIKEPADFQVDSLEKLEFYPKVIRNLYKISCENCYELVMATNQDGLGTAVFPEETFWPVQNKLLQTLEGEGIKFNEILIDRSLPADNAPTRKPRTGMFGQYLNGDYDLKNSFVIGDRLTDIELAYNLGAKAIWLANPERSVELTGLPFSVACVLISEDWDQIYAFLKLPPRITVVERTTKETVIKLTLNLDGKGETEISTGLKFFDHMLEQLAKHSGCDLQLTVKGDLEVDEHHTVEDTALALGNAFRRAIGDKIGLERYGFMLPMDDSLAQAAIDFSGRPWLVWSAEFKREKIGDLPTELFYHFFKSFSDAAMCNLNIKAEGNNEHHKIEAMFKSVARAIKMAVKRDITNQSLPTTKGVL